MEGLDEQKKIISLRNLKTSFAGEYKIRLADGRLQVVSYVANKYGFNPRITYVFDAETGPELLFNATDAKPNSGPPPLTRGPEVGFVIYDYIVEVYSGYKGRGPAVAELVVRGKAQNRHAGEIRNKLL